MTDKHVVQPTKPRISLRRLLIYPLSAIAAAFVITGLITNKPPRSHSAVKRANPQPNDLCNVVGTNPDATDLWQFNTRSNCLSSHICISEAKIYHTSNFSDVQCRVLSSQFADTGRRFPAVVKGKTRTCSWFQRQHVHCAHGRNLQYKHNNAKIECPELEHMEMQPAEWLEDISVVVANYPFPWNIFHFSNIALDVYRTVSNLPALLEQWGWENVHASDGNRYTQVKRINVIFQMQKKFDWSSMHWQHELLQRVHDSLAKKFPVRFQYMEDLGKVCLRNAVLMGIRGDVNLWPFLNDSNAKITGSSIPKDAVEFKRLAYEAFDLPASLPDERVSELPPFVVGYSQRNSWKHGAYYRWGSSRRLRDDDHEWFVSMLQNETKAAGAEFRNLSFDSGQNLKTQVETITQVGFLVGLHGANLVNSIFMHPFSAIMELLPNGATVQCYVGGLNTGLKYLRFESSQYASVEESECDPNESYCTDYTENRLIKLSRSSDRKRARQFVREGLIHLKTLRERFPKGIPVRYNKETAHYDIDGIK